MSRCVNVAERLALESMVGNPTSTGTAAQHHTLEQPANCFANCRVEEKRMLNNKEFLLDKRLAERFIKRGTLTRSEHNNHLANLKDVAGKSEQMPPWEDPIPQPRRSSSSAAVVEQPLVVSTIASVDGGSSEQAESTSLSDEAPKWTNSAATPSRSPESASALEPQSAAPVSITPAPPATPTPAAPMPPGNSGSSDDHTQNQ